jgi:Cu(I)/Ag(I) efflux system membrane fusion protein
LIVGLIVGRLTAPGQRPSEPLQAEHERAEGASRWTCSMHPQIQLSESGSCPLCGMDLIPVAEGSSAAPDAAVLEMSPAAKALARVRTAPVLRRVASAEVRLVGKIDVDETRTREITAWVGGRLERLYIDFGGMDVRRGDHMVEIYSPELISAQEELLQALRTEHWSRSGESPSLLQGVVDGTVEAAREKLRLLGLNDEQVREIEERGQVERTVTIYAPMNGTVLAKRAVEGVYVQTGTTIYEMADLSRLWVRLDAYESDLQWIRYGQEVEFTTPSSPGRSFRGTVSFVDPMVDPITRTAKVRLVVDNRERLLKPGMFVRAIVRASVAAGGRVITPDLAGKWMCPMHPDVVSDHADTCSICGMDLVPVEELGFEVAKPPAEPPLLIPASAPLITGERAIVYVQRPDAERPTFEGREVLLGPRLGDWYVVESGLREGESVVVHGAFKIDSDLQIQARPSMMSPDEFVELAPAENVPSEFRVQLTSMVAANFELIRALAEDDFAGAQQASRALREHLKAIDRHLLSGEAHERWMQLWGRLRAPVDRAAAAQGITSLREALRDLTAPLADVIRSFGLREGTVARLMHCPMAFDNSGADWVQTGEQIANPYYGASMLRCGSETEVLVGGVSQ